MVIIGILQLNKHGIINIYIPKKLRILCLKRFKSAEEKEADAQAEVLGERIGQNRDLVMALQIQPGGRGFRLDDDFFENVDEKSNY